MSEKRGDSGSVKADAVPEKPNGKKQATGEVKLVESLAFAKAIGADIEEPSQASGVMTPVIALKDGVYTASFQAGPSTSKLPVQKKARQSKAKAKEPKGNVEEDFETEDLGGIVKMAGLTNEDVYGKRRNDALDKPVPAKRARLAIMMENLRPDDNKDTPKCLDLDFHPYDSLNAEQRMARPPEADEETYGALVDKLLEPYSIDKTKVYQTYRIGRITRLCSEIAFHEQQLKDDREELWYRVVEEKRAARKLQIMDPLERSIEKLKNITKDEKMAEELAVKMINLVCDDLTGPGFKPRTWRDKYMAARRELNAFGKDSEDGRFSYVENEEIEAEVRALQRKQRNVSGRGRGRGRGRGAVRGNAVGAGRGRGRGKLSCGDRAKLKMERYIQQTEPTTVNIGTLEGELFPKIHHRPKGYPHPSTFPRWLKKICLEKYPETFAKYFWPAKWGASQVDAVESAEKAYQHRKELEKRRFEEERQKDELKKSQPRKKRVARRKNSVDKEAKAIEALLGNPDSCDEAVVPKTCASMPQLSQLSDSEKEDDAVSKEMNTAVKPGTTRRPQSDTDDDYDTPLLTNQNCNQYQLQLVEETRGQNQEKEKPVNEEKEVPVNEEKEGAANEGGDLILSEEEEEEVMNETATDKTDQDENDKDKKADDENDADKGEAQKEKEHDDTSDDDDDGGDVLRMFRASGLNI